MKWQWSLNFEIIFRSNLLVRFVKKIRDLSLSCLFVFLFSDYFVPRNVHSSGDLFLRLVEGNSWKFTVIHSRRMWGRTGETERLRDNCSSYSKTVVKCINVWVHVRVRVMFVRHGKIATPSTPILVSRVWVCACECTRCELFAYIRHAIWQYYAVFSMWFMENPPPLTPTPTHTYSLRKQSCTN